MTTWRKSEEKSDRVRRRLPREKRLNLSPAMNFRTLNAGTTRSQIRSGARRRWSVKEMVLEEEKTNNFNLEFQSLLCPHQANQQIGQVSGFLGF